MSELHQGSPVALEKAIKDVFSDLEKHLKSQREKLQDLYKEWNFWQAAGALLDFDRFEVSDFNITDLQIQLIQAQMDELRLENDLKGTMEFAREIFGQSASGFKTPSIPNPLPSADLFPLSAKYSHPSPPPKSYGRQMQQRRQEEDFPSYFRKRLATLPSIDPQLTVNPSQKPPTPPQTYPIRSRKPRPPPLRPLLSQA